MQKNKNISLKGREGEVGVEIEQQESQPSLEDWLSYSLLGYYLCCVF